MGTTYDFTVKSNFLKAAIEEIKKICKWFFLWNYYLEKNLVSELKISFWIKNKVHVCNIKRQNSKWREPFNEMQNNAREKNHFWKKKYFRHCSKMKSILKLISKNLAWGIGIGRIVSPKTNRDQPFSLSESVLICKSYLSLILSPKFFRYWKITLNYIS